MPVTSKVVVDVAIGGGGGAVAAVAVVVVVVLLLELHVLLLQHLRRSTWIRTPLDRASPSPPA